MARRRVWEQAQERLANLEQWCRHMATKLENASYARKRQALEALEVCVKVWRADHEPRYDISMSVPLDGDGKDIVDRWSTRSS
jgi:hypothetical protein